MTLRRLAAGLAGLIAISLAVAWLSGWFEEKIPPGQVERVAAGIPADARTTRVVRVVEPAIEWASGAVQSARQTTVAAQILARIEDVHVAAGNEVAQGDLLVSLDARDLEARLQQAREVLKAAEAQRELARQELTRTEELLNRGVTTRQRFDQVFSVFRVAEAEVDGIRQTVTESETALSYTQIRAPVAGRVIDRLAEPGDTTAPGQPLLRLYDPSTLRIEAPVRESLAVDLKVGDRLRVEISALQETVTGTIDEIVPYAEPGARTLLVKVRLPGDPRLFAGMFARIAVPAGVRARLLVPVDAVTRIGQLEFVAVVEDGHTARRMVTSAGLTADGRLEILSGLKEGEQVMR
jgi:RND family efflux transporter MFP subunit